MKKILMGLLFGLFLFFGCEETEEVDCEQLALEYTAAAEIYATAGTDVTLEQCQAVAAAYKVGLDEGCDGYTEEEYSTLNELCPSGTTQGDLDDAAEFADEGNVALENLLSDLYNEEEEPSMDALRDSVDAAYANFTDALASDPNNKDANFGIALTGLMHILLDPAYEELGEKWENYFDNNEPFEVDPSETNALSIGGFNFPLNINGMTVPIEPFLRTPLILAKMVSDSNEVAKVSDIQHIVQNNIMPFVNAGIAGLAKVEQDPEFVFTVSSEMQPDVGASPMELDMTEVYMIDMILHAMKGIGGAVIGHNFDIISHDEAGLLDAFTPGSDFGTITSTGATDLADAHAAMMGSIDKLNAAMDFLQAETDDQDNDMIPYEVDDASDFDNMRDELTKLKSDMTGPTWLYWENEGDEYWDDDYDYWVYEEGEEDSIQIDIQQFFTNPLLDLKEMVPPYTLTVGTDTDTDWEWEHNEDLGDEDPTITITLHDSLKGNNSDEYFTRFGGYFGYEITWGEDDGSWECCDSTGHSYYVEGTGLWALDTNFYAHMYHSNWENQDIIDQHFKMSLDDLMDELTIEYMDTTEELTSRIYLNGSFEVEVYSDGSWQNDYGIDDIYFNEEENTWTMTLETEYNIEYEREYSWVYPKFTWEADDFQSWKAAWPDPTINGIFPSWTIDDLLEFLGLNNEEDWEKTSRW